MFMVTVPKNSWRRVLAVLGCAAALCGVIFGVTSLTDGVRAAAASADGSTVKSAEDMKNFLLGFGVETDVSTAQVLQVTIPRKFDKSFQAFNEVIRSSGMDLSKYKGKMVEKWVLQSPNRTVENQTAYAVLLVRKARVVGGYLLYQPSGEVIGLREMLDAEKLQQPGGTLTAQAEGTAALPEDGSGGQDCAAGDTAEEEPPAALPEAAPAAPTAAEAQGEEAGVFPTD